MTILLKQILKIIRFSLYDLKAKYSGSLLGTIWALTEPLICVLLYKFVYTIAFGGADIDGYPYYIWLSFGIAPWFFISDGLKGVCTSFRDYSYLIKKTEFNKGSLPLIRTSSSFVSHILFLIIVYIISIFSGISIKISPVFPIVIFSAFFFILSIGKILAVLCSRLKDTANFLSVLLNILFWVTPIFWTPSGISPDLTKDIYLNPIAMIIKNYRDTLLSGRIPTLFDLLYPLFFSLIFYLAGLLFYKKSLLNISDKL